MFRGQSLRQGRTRPWSASSCPCRPRPGRLPIFSFTLAWNEFLLALVFTVDQNTMTVPIKLSMMVVGDQYIWGQLTAGAIVASIPIAILYFIGQRFVVQGLAAGAVKG